MEKRIVILGGGESGCGAAVLAKKLGFDVFLSDFGRIADKYKQMLDEQEIPWEEGGHTKELILNAGEVIKSPGIPNEAPIVVQIKDAGIPIISEIEFAGRYTRAKMVCITGSNGKTTTTSLIYHIFREAGLDVGLAGNIGNSLALQVAEGDKDYYIVELSSFQLDNMYEFRANVAVLLNITPDHLDRYGYNMQNYVDAKLRILQNQQSDDAFVYWNDDPIIKKELPKYRHGKLYPFAEEKREGNAAYTHEEKLVFTEPTPFNMELEELSLTGKHNLYNSMAAALSACLLDIDKQEIRGALGDFEGVEHRLEYVATVNGVRYINDSKATNVNSCWYALESMPENTVLILGGKDKGNDYSEILPLVKEKVKAIVCMGKDNAKLLDFFGKEVPEIYDTHSIEEAVAKCASVACPGDTVLLSPCCASFDLFNSYEDRGHKFKEQVGKLKV